MPDSLHPAAAHHMPSFITAPSETDVLMVVMGVILVLAVMMFGILFFRLHTLPERMAHKSKKIQFEIVAVLGLIALFTHMHIFWVAGLLLAIIELPDFGNSLQRIAGSAEKVAGLRSGEGAVELMPDTANATRQISKATEVPFKSHVGDRQGDGSIPMPRSQGVSTLRKELDHA
jgi:hypothetical protein